MSLDSGAIRDRIVSLAARTGRFDKIEGHEPPSAPGRGIRGAVWVERIAPIKMSLNVVHAKVVVNLRVTRDLPGASDDLDRVDPEITAAVDAVLAELASDFDLGGTVRAVDWGGSEGEAVDAPAGYFEQEDHKYRAVVIQIPILVNDAWSLGGA